MNFSDKIRKIRKQLGITQEKLADDLGVSFATINRLEQGLTMPQTSTIRKLEEYCMNKNIELNDSQPQNIGFELIHATDIEDWASKNPREMQGLLPELVSNLIKESLVNESYELNFPHGDKIYMDGYDGFLKVSGVVSQFVPDGKSIWELGATTKTSTQKICDDYHKRDTQVSIEQKKDNTFILVTLKSFSMQSVDKIKNNIGGGAWKEVRIYTANTLADWLAHNLGTSVWFYEKICNNHLELDSIQRAWDKMSKSTSPSLSCKLFTIGRTSEIEKLNNNIETQKVVTVAGPSRDESFGFVLSSLLCNSSQKNLARAIVCNDYVSLQQINSFVHNKIIILNFNLSDYNFYGSKNTIIIINGKDVDNRSTIDIQLNQRPQSLLFDVLKDEMKVSQRKLSELSHKVNNSVFLIIRELEDEVAHSTNVWRKSEKLLELIPLLIVGKVNVKSESDKTILSKFLASGQSPDQYLSVIKSWENVENSPIFVYGDYIRVSLKEELWCSLNIDEQTVATLLESIKTIFTTINPKYELPADQQFAASVYNKNWTYNEYTVQELLDSCILLAIHNNKQDEINWLFKDILDGISTKETFFTIADYMKQIAECSPETFTSYIEKEVEKDDSIIWELFKNNDSSFLTGGHDYCKLLWALELLTELDKYKFRACTILFKLTLKKYKYTISNSPTESLENILWLYNNRTALCASEKTDFMEYGIKKYKQDFIRLALKTILKTTGFFSGVALKWRNAEIAEETISYPILFNAIDRIIKVSLENLCFSDTKILESLVNNNSLIPFETFNAIIDYILQTYKPNTTESTELYEYMLNTQYNMVRYKDNNSQKYLNLLSSVVSQLKPTDELEASLVYFKHFGFNNCPIIEAIDDDFRAQEKKAFVCLNKMLADLMTKYDHIKVLTRIINI